MYLVVYTKGLRGLGGLDIFFLAFISGALMNPARSLAPAPLLSVVLGRLWLYWSATFMGSSVVALLVRKVQESLVKVTITSV